MGVSVRPESRLDQLRRRAEERRLQRRTSRQARQVFAASDPLEQFLRTRQERPAAGGVRGGTRGILPTLEAAFPTEKELGKAATRVGTVPGGAARAARTVIGKPLGLLNEQLLGRLPLIGGTFERQGTGLLDVIKRQEQAEEEVRPNVFLGNRLLSDLTKFGLEFEAAKTLPLVGRLLRRGPATAKTPARRIAQRGLTEGAQFSGFETGLSLLEGESVEEAARRGQFGFAAGTVLGGAAKGIGEVIGRKGAERLAQLAARRNAAQNLQETAAVRQVVQPKIQQLRAAEARVSGVPLAVEPAPTLAPTQVAEAGFLDAPSVGQGIKKFIQRNLTSRGDLPKKVHDRMIQRDGGVGVTERQIAFTLRDFRKAKRQNYGFGRSIPESDLMALDRALKGEFPIDQLPEPFQPIVRQMRNEVDALSRRLIDSGAIEGPLEATIEQNIGTYATRSYRVFDDPTWARKVSEDVRNKAKALIRSEFPTLTEDEVAGQIEALLYKGQETGSHIGLMGKLGSKDLSILKRRSDIPPEIRALWGEHTDLTVNYARSATKMAHLIENHRFLTDVRREGLGQFFFEQPTVQSGQAFQAQIAAEGSKALEPLNGLYTTPEIARAFQEIAVPQAVPDWLRAYMKVNGIVKFTKTILSMMTHVRNTSGNTGFAVANGHWRVTKSVDALRAIGANTGISDVVSSPKNIERWRNYFLKLQRLRVVDESARAGELQDVLADAVKGNLSDPARSLPVRVTGVGLKVAKTLYRAEDDVWKVFGFENELARYRAALPDVPLEQIETRVAEIVRNTHPTYSLVPRGVKLLRRFPLVGNFVSFPSEVARTLYNTMRLTAEELADPALRGIGAQRLAGLTAAATATAAAATGTRQMLGIEKGTDEDMRRFLPPWSENSTLIHLGRSPDGNLRVIDLSYTDPYSYLRTPLTAFLRGENWENKITEAALEAAEPFVGEEILVGKLLDISRNTKPSGGPVFNPQDPFLDRMEDILAHVYDALEPGTVTSAKRIEKGLTGKQTAYGRSYDPELEALAVFTGMRIMEVDVSQSLSFRVGKFTRDQSDAMRILRSVATRQGTVGDEEIRGAVESMDRARRATFQALHQDIQAAERLGVSPVQIRRILRERLSVTKTADLLAGRYRPFRPTGQFLQSLKLGPAERLRRVQLIGNFTAGLPEPIQGLLGRR